VKAVDRGCSAILPSVKRTQYGGTRCYQSRSSRRPGRRTRCRRSHISWLSATREGGSSELDWPVCIGDRRCSPPRARQSCLPYRDCRPPSQLARQTFLDGPQDDCLASDYQITDAGDLLRGLRLTAERRGKHGSKASHEGAAVDAHLHGGRMVGHERCRQGGTASTTGDDCSISFRTGPRMLAFRKLVEWTETMTIRRPGMPERAE
jgi:hypothetical protein